jgi:hypothetical protein
MKDTLFVDAINFLKGKENAVVSLSLLRLGYENHKRFSIDKHLNEIGDKILKTDGEPSDIAEILSTYMTDKLIIQKERLNRVIKN